MLRAAALLGLLLVLPGCAGDGPARGIVLITLDTTRADRLGAYGSRAGATPNLDRLASRAVRFDQAVAPAPITLPSHASMLTGRYPPRHGIRYNGMFRLVPGERTVAEALREAGWRTAAVPAAFPLAAETGIGQGFEVYRDLFQEPGAGSLPEDAQRSAEDVARLGIAWLREHAAERFFLWLHFYDAHDPYVPPEPWASRFDGRPYEGEIAFVDNEVGRVFQALTQLGLWDDTLVVVAGDHGEGLGEHGEPTHKNLVYETTLRVPLLLKPPGSGARGRVVDEPVSLVDVGPTLADYAGVTALADVDGVSLRGATRGTAPGRRSLYFETLAGQLSFGWAPLHGLRRGSFKLIDGPRHELYDLAADPREAADLADVQRELATDLRDELASRRAGWERGGEAAGSAAAAMDAATLERLASLGYVGGVAPASSRQGIQGPEPRRLAHLETPVAEGRRRMRDRDWAGALASFRAVLAEDPDNRYALGEASKAALAAGEIDAAVAWARRLTERSPEAAGWIQWTEVLLAKGDVAAAAEAAAAGLARHPEDPTLRFQRALALVRAGRARQALDEIGVTVGADPSRPWPNLRLAEAAARARLGDAAGASAALERAVADGFRNRPLVEADTAFAPLRALPAYGRLLPPGTVP